MSPLLVVGHRLTPHGLHHRPLTARLSVIMICLPHIRVREKRVYDTDVIFRWLRCRNLSAPSGSERSFRWMPQPGIGIGWSRDGVRSVADERTFDPMQEPAVVCISRRPGAEYLPRHVVRTPGP